MFARVLTDPQIKRVHETSLRILQEIGVVIPHQEALRHLADFGANVKNTTARFPEPVVMRALRLAGKQFILRGRDPMRTAPYGYGVRNFSSISGEGYWLDHPGGERRFSSLKDVRTAADFGEKLENLTVVGAMADPHEIPVSYRCVAVLAEMLRYTTKPVTHWFYNRATTRWLVEIITALRGDAKKAAEEPLLAWSLEPISPLRFPFDGVDLLFEAARIRVPTGLAPMAQMGASAPMSIAGTLALQNAEILAGLCLTQAVCPGLPVLYCGTCHALDMRTTQMVFGGPEQAIFGVAMTQMGRHYGLPVSVNVGLTDSKRVDAQAGLEIGLTMMLAAAAGADAFGLQGICGVDQAASLDLLVFQQEVVSYVTRVMGEIEFSDEALGFDVLREVGPGGTFLTHEHTVERLRKEFWVPSLLDRQFYDAWLREGALSLEERCTRRKEELLASPPAAAPLDRNLDRTLSEIVAAAQKELAQ